jgi:hypothetical protein
MSQVIVGRPIAGAKSWAEEIALTLAAACKPTLDGMRGSLAKHAAAVEERKRSIAAAQAERVRTEEAAAAAASEVTVFDQRGAEVEPSPPQTNRNIAVGLALVGFAALFVLPALGFVAAGVAIWFFGRFKAALAAVRAANEDHEDAFRRQLGELQAKANALGGKAAEARASLVSLEAELAAFKAPSTDWHLPIRGMVRVHCPVSVGNVAGHRVAASPLAAGSSALLRSVELAGLEAAQRALAGALDRVDRAGALLAPRDGDAHDLSSLVGEETDLKTAMLTWLEALREAPVEEHRVPVVGSKHAALVALKGPRSRDDAPSMALSSVDEMQRAKAALRKLDAAADAARAEAAAGPSPLRQSYGRLHATIERFADRRTDAKAVLQQNFMSATARAELLSVHRYCPRCNRIPAFFFQKLGCPFDEAHLHDPAEILARVSQDPDIARRLQGNVDLRVRYFETYEQVQFMMAQVEDAALALQTATATERDRTEQMMGSHVGAALKSYRSVLRELLTGSPVEHVELARSARLHLSPTTSEWTCAACNQAWSDPETTRLGEVTRVKSDLLVPLWNTLWTEKDDFRKSEVFRTNDELTRYTEKEAEKLLFVHESYKSDLRGVRERLVAAGSDAESSREKLEATLDGLQSLGLMTHTRATEILSRLEGASSATPTTAKKEAEKNETILGALPRQQQATRPTAADPIQFFFAPREIFGAVATKVGEIDAPRPAGAFVDRSETARLPAPMPAAVAQPGAIPVPVQSVAPKPAASSIGLASAPPPPYAPAPPPRSPFTAASLPPPPPPPSIVDDKEEKP